MKGKNKHIEMVEDISQIEENRPCGHCIKKRDLKKNIHSRIWKKKKKILEERRDRDHREIDFKYDGKQAKLKAQYEESIIGLIDD